MTPTKVVVIYHGNCFDGMASAWAAWKRFKDRAAYIPAKYGDPFPVLADASDTQVYIVDFSYPKEVLLAINDQVECLTVLDHHKTAQKDLESLDFCTFDMNKSGARLAWEHFHFEKIQTVPRLITYIEDRDLWRFALPYSSEINAWIQSHPMDIAIYDRLYPILETSTGFQEAINQGQAIERYKETMILAQCKEAHVEDIGGYLVPCVNSTILFSEVGNQLCKTYPNAPFAAYFTLRPDGKQYGLRSIGDFDVSEVAKKLGGGGHKNAAGFFIKNEGR